MRSVLWRAGVSIGVFFVAGCQPAPIRQEAQIESFSASSLRVARGESVELIAVFRNGSGSISPGVGNVTSGVPVELTPMATTEFTLAVMGANSVFASLIVEVTDQPVGAVTVPSVVVAGETAEASREPVAGATYTWNVSSATVLEGQGTPSILFRAAAQGTIGFESRAVLNGVTRVAAGSALIHERPVITRQPASQQVTVGGALALSIEAAGNGSLTYQWRLDDLELAGETEPQLQRPVVSVSDTGRYDCLITSSLGGTTVSVISAAAVISVLGLPDSTQTTLGVSPQSLVADGVAAATVTLTARDAQGQALPNVAVSLQTNGINDVLTPTQGMTDAAGLFTATLTSTTAGSKLVTASVGAVTKATAVQFIAGAVASVSVTATPATLIADGSSSVLSVTARDAQGNGVAGEVVTLTTTGSQNVLTPTAGVTNAAGVFSAALGSTRAEAKMVTATIGSLFAMTTVLFEVGAPEPSQSTLVAAPTSVVADGVALTTLTLTVRDAQGNPVPGLGVALSAGGTGNSLGAITGTTSAAGTFVTTLSSTVAESKPLTATAGSLSLTGTVTFLAGPPSPLTSTLTAAPTVVIADGLATTTVTTTVRDAMGNLVPAQPVTLASSGSANVFGTTSGSTNLQGVFVTTLSSTAPQTKSLTATVGAFSLSATVAFQWPVCSAPLLGAPPLYTLGGVPMAVASADFNLDGRPDVAVANYSSGTVSILFGTGPGMLAPQVTVLTVTYPNSVVAADFNGDGRPDLATAGPSSGLGVHLNTGGGGFGAPVRLISSGADAITAADLNGDGRLDLVQVKGSTSTMGVWLNDGSGGFLSMAEYPTGGGSLHSVTSGDFNADGRRDLAVSNAGIGTVSVFLNTGAGVMGAAISFPTAPGPRSIVSADFNGDGRPDLATASWGTVSILLNTGLGTFALPTNSTASAAGLNERSLTAADLNGDGRADLVVGSGDGVINVLLNLGTGALAPQVTYVTGAYGQSFASAHLNADGHLDLAVASESGHLSLLLNTGGGVFPVATAYPTGIAPRHVTAADFDGDGLPDVAVTNSANEVSVLINSGGNSFTPRVSYPTGTNAQEVRSADFNEDGHLDLVVTNLGSNSVSVLLNDRLGSFAAQVSYATGDQPRSVITGDFNADGHVDLAVANSASNTVSVLTGSGTGTFAPQVAWATGATPYSVASADFNGDGRLDLAVTNNGANTMGVLLNTGTGFAAQTAYPTGSFGQGLVASDLNGDGRPDLAMSASAQVNVWLNSGNGIFAPLVVYPTSVGLGGLVVADFTGDGMIDLAVSRDQMVGLLRGAGSGTFLPQLSYLTTQNSVALVAADFNADNRPDLVVANTLTSSLSLFPYQGCSL